MMPDLVLSIEAAVAGGSVALLRGDDVVACWHSNEKVSRSEELLIRIAEILDRSKVDKKDLTRIAVSNGPGSYTGIRIGIATAMGLAKALNIACVGVFLLKAISMRSALEIRHVVVVPIGRNGYCWQVFEGFAFPRSIGTGNLDEMMQALVAESESLVVTHGDTFITLQADDKCGKRLVDAGQDLAVAVGIASSVLDDGLEPFYARDTAITVSGEKV